MGARVIDWLIYAAIVAALMGAVYEAWERTVGDHYREQQLAIDQPVIAGWKARAEKAEAANRDLAGQVTQLRHDFDGLRANATARIAASNAARARAEAQAKDATQMLANEHAILERVKSGEICIGICERASALLGKLIHDSATP